MELSETEALIKAKIPMAGHLGFSLRGWDGQRLELWAPFEANRNHHGTAFGGSLAMASIISGYAMTFMAIGDALGDGWLQTHTLVIKDFSCQYKRPVTGDIVTVSEPVNGSTGGFGQRLMAEGKARLAVETRIRDGGVLQLAATATYVAFLRPG
jgi:thioesterase domain-containing protein